MKKDDFLESVGDERRKKHGKWRRMIILGALLAAAGVLLWRGGGFTVPDTQLDTAAATPAVTAKPTVAPSAASARSVRELAYDKDVAALEKLIANTSADDAILNQAAAQLAKMVAGHQTELGLNEALEKAGFDPCMVLLQNDALTVTVGASELTATESATILAICTAHSDVAVDNIRIMTGQSLYP